MARTIFLAATSAGMRSQGGIVSAACSWRTPRLSILRISDSTNPGATWTTATPSAFSSARSDSARARTANFDIAYAETPGAARKPVTLPTMASVPCVSLRFGRTACAVRITPKTLVSNCLR